MDFFKSSIQNQRKLHSRDCQVLLSIYSLFYKIDFLGGFCSSLKHGLIGQVFCPEFLFRNCSEKQFNFLPVGRFPANFLAAPLHPGAGPSLHNLIAPLRSTRRAYNSDYPPRGSLANTSRSLSTARTPWKSHGERSWFLPP